MAGCLFLGLGNCTGIKILMQQNLLVFSNVNFLTFDHNKRGTGPDSAKKLAKNPDAAQNTYLKI
jgi:hypothetical protein